MNNTPIRAVIALLVVIALAGCAAQPTDQQQAARMCDQGETLTCDNFAGEQKHCFCASRAELRRMFETLTTY